MQKVMERPMRTHRPVSGWIRGVQPICLVVLLGCILGRSAPADELPRYKLKVGQEIVYRTTDPPTESGGGKGGKNTSQSVVEWTVNVGAPKRRLHLEMPLLPKKNEHPHAR